MPTALLMENAARSAAAVAWRLLGGQPGDVVILCGPGNNGGDGLALARHLANRDCRVACAILDPRREYTGDAKVMFDIATAMGMRLIPAAVEQVTAPVGLVVDALFGTGLSKPLDGLAADLAKATHSRNRPTLALDLPSGLDCDTGEPIGGLAVKATHTVTFVAPKAGFGRGESAAFTGDVFVGDIGVPKAAVALAMGAPGET